MKMKRYRFSWAEIIFNLKSAHVEIVMKCKFIIIHTLKKNARGLDSTRMGNKYVYLRKLRTRRAVKFFEIE